MAGSFSDALEIELLDHVLGTGAAFSVPANIFVALSTADPTESGGSIAEPGDGYIRKVCNSWDSAAARVTENTAKITYDQASGEWGDITHWAIFDAETDGTMLAYGDFDTHKLAPVGTNLYIEIGEIIVTFSGGGICTNLANKLLDHVFKVGGGYTPETIWVALFTANPTDDGVSGTECSAGNYVRKAHSAWDGAASGATENDGAITFIAADASWGEVGFFMLIAHESDAASSSNTLIYGTVDTPKTIGIDDVAEYADGALDITMT